MNTQTFRSLTAVFVFVLALALFTPIRVHADGPAPSSSQLVGTYLGVSLDPSAWVKIRFILKSDGSTTDVSSGASKATSGTYTYQNGVVKIFGSDGALKYTFNASVRKNNVVHLAEIENHARQYDYVCDQISTSTKVE